MKMMIEDFLLGLAIGLWTASVFMLLHVLYNLEYYSTLLTSLN